MAFVACYEPQYWSAARGFIVSSWFHLIARPNSGEQTLIVHRSVFCTVVHLYYTQQRLRCPPQANRTCSIFSSPIALFGIYISPAVHQPSLSSHLFISQFSTQSCSSLFAERNVIESSLSGLFQHNFNPQLTAGCSSLNQSQKMLCNSTHQIFCCLFHIRF